MTTEGYFIIKKGAAKEAFEKRSFELSVPKSNEVQIEVEAFGLNYADVMARRGLYREAPPLPCIVGYEVVGKIVATGESVSKEWIGKRVLGFTRFGAYAKHVNTPLHGIVEIDQLPTAEVLALGTQGVTAYYMSNYMQNTYPNEKVLIHAAAGGVGSLLIQLSKLKGATVFAKIGDESKRALVERLGADHVVNYRQKDYLETCLSLLNKERFDVIYNPVAGSTFKKDMRLLGSGGRVVLFGGSELSNGKFGILSGLNFLRKMGLLLPIGLMMRSKSILGVNMLKIADFKPEIIQHCLLEMLSLYEQGKIQVEVGGTYPEHELAEAHDLLESGKSQGKISVYWT